MIVDGSAVVVVVVVVAVETLSVVVNGPSDSNAVGSPDGSVVSDVSVVSSTSSSSSTG